MSYAGEYNASEYPDGHDAPRWGWRGSREMAELRAAKDAEIERLRKVLREAREELDRHGYGDFHYGEMPRDPGVLAALAAIDEVLK